MKTVRGFGLEREAPVLARSLSDLALKTAAQFGIRGYARVDFRTDRDGRPFILEINANPVPRPSCGVRGGRGGGRSQLRNDDWFYSRGSSIRADKRARSGHFRRQVVWAT